MSFAAVDGFDESLLRWKQIVDVTMCVDWCGLFSADGLLSPNSRLSEMMGQLVPMGLLLMFPLDVVSQEHDGSRLSLILMLS